MGERISEQERKEVAIRADQEEGLHHNFEGLLNAITRTPPMYQHPRLGYLRNFVGMVDRNKDVFTLMYGDDTTSLPVPRGPDATKGYVKHLSEGGSGLEFLGFGGKPILSVVSTETNHHDEVMRSEDKQTVKLTQLRLVDGSGDQIHARLAINLTETGRCFKQGDKIRLDSFTELRFRINNNSPRVPGLFIHGVSRVGNAPLFGCTHYNHSIDNVIHQPNRAQ